MQIAPRRADLSLLDCDPDDVPPSFTLGSWGGVGGRTGGNGGGGGDGTPEAKKYKIK